MTEQELTQTIKVLKNEVEILKGRLEPNATGYIHTALDVINGRIDELIQEALYRQSELTDSLKDINGNLDANLNADVYDGYKDHTEAMEQARLRTLGSSAYQRAGAMEQARLRRIQDAAAGRSTDDYEHTEEYYDKERNKAIPDIQNMTSDGLSNRTMKQKHGQAVQTVSEMMQEELEPLPINTFE